MSIRLKISLTADGTGVIIESRGMVGRIYRTHAEADAFVAGFRAAHDLVRNMIVAREIEDLRPIRAAPE